MFPRLSILFVIALAVVLFFSGGVMAAGACSARTGAACNAAKSGPAVRVVRAAAKVRPFARVRSALGGRCGCN